MNRQILRLSIPNIISNITVPLLGMVDMAIVGRLGDEVMIGAMALATAIFNFIYWNFAFLRMGTSGFTAQAYGARNMGEMAANLVRAVVVALSVAAVLLLIQWPLSRFMLYAMGGSEGVSSLAARYFYVRIWAAPATLSLYALQGWYIGMQNSRFPMIISIVVNILNILFSLLCVFALDMGFVGVAWGTLVAQYGGLAVGVALWVRYYRRITKYIDIRSSIRRDSMLRFFSVNRDIFIRTACIVMTYTFFTSASAKMGDLYLAVNMLLMQLYTLYSYFMDGFAYSAESLIGKFVGASNSKAIRVCLRHLFGWWLGIAVVSVGLYICFWQDLLSLFTDSEAIIELAREYILWVIVIPILSFVPFMIDGALIGATKNVIMRKTVLFSTILFFISYIIFSGPLGNDGLWVSFTIFMVARGASQYVMLKPLGWF